MSVFSRRQTEFYVLVICVWVVVLAGMFYLVAKPVRRPSLDFYTYYTGASAIHLGMPLYPLATHTTIAKELGIITDARYVYLPTLAILMLPILLMSPYIASLCWFAVNVGLLLTAVGLLFRQSNLHDYRMRVSLLLLPMLFTPVLMTFYLGQVNFLILLLIVLAYMAFARRQPLVVGFLLALAAWIKIWPIALIAYFVWKREWRVILGAVIGLLLIGVLTFAIAGVGQTMSFFTDMWPKLTPGDPGHDHLNQSIPGVFAKMFAPSSDYVLPLIQSPILAQQGSRIASLLIVAATVLLCSRPILLKDRRQFSTEFMLVVMATLLITGRLWEASLTLLLPAYFFIGENLEQEHIPNWKLITLPIASIMLINVHRLIWTLANPDKNAYPWFLMIFPFLGLMLMWFIFAARRFREIKEVKAGYGKDLIEPAYPSA